MIHEYNVAADCVKRGTDFFSRPHVFDREEGKAFSHEKKAADDPGMAEAVYHKTRFFLETTHVEEYAARGEYTAMMGFPLVVMCGFFVYMALLSVLDIGSSGFNFYDLLMIVFSLIVVVGSVWISNYLLLGNDWFSYRHGAVRFNCKAQQVYVFYSPSLGGVRTYQWKDMLAYIDRSGVQDGSSVSGFYVLKFYACDSERKSYYGSFKIGSSFSRYEDCVAWWEYLRRYMEEGPDSVPEPEWYLSDRLSLKESFLRWFPLREMRRDRARGLDVKSAQTRMVLMSPLLVFFSLGHFFSILTSKKVKWPENVRDACDGR
ncbi:DUF6708 domain-containing protein [Salinicola sp. DM10]|uniref:DUF6708 domain-containing protein n=1 Tax=Salinicola sp. DM10 TaxID=2815721 RepID=UPI001A8DA499|nr:DUF6708 domain-containing protein [Salinicola sp. DM10]MCE3027514.1 hypothetical protein [Salinicola sp. DM10]